MNAARKRTLYKVLVFGIAAAVVAGIGVLVKVETGSRDAPAKSAVQHGPPVTSLRTVLVRSASFTEVSKPNEPVKTYVVDGAMPARPMQATVLSDENCAPDKDGISHCRNKMRMDDGTMMTVVHPHRMEQVGCLSPGEKVMVRPVA